jgi:hypothetical protein
MKQSILLFSFLTIGFGILYWLLKPPTDQLSTIDSDYDGVIDGNDKEKNTTWLVDTSNYKLKDYVDTDGLIDRSKTKSLCDCWEFPDIRDRKILKCEDNLNWFVYEDKLVEYRMEDSELGRFYSNYGRLIATRSDNDIEKKHEILFPEHYTKTEDVKINEPPSQDLNKLVTISYNGKKYKLKKVFTTDKGIDYNKANYRYKNNKWEIQTNPPNGPWTSPKVENINFLLSKVAIEIKSGEKKKPETVEEEIEKSKPPVMENKNAENTSSDIYWIQLNNMNDFELKNKKAEIENSEGTMIPFSKDGKAAKKNVKTRIKYF